VNEKKKGYKSGLSPNGVGTAVIKGKKKEGLVFDFQFAWKESPAREEGKDQWIKRERCSWKKKVLKRLEKRRGEARKR